MKILSKFEMKKIMGGEVTQEQIGDGESSDCGTYSCGSCPIDCKCGASKNDPCTKQ